MLHVQYESDDYALRLDSLSTQTPSDHPDKQPLILAAELHRDSMLRSESVEDAEHTTRNIGIRGSLFGQAFDDPGHIVDIGLDDTDFTELRDEFRDDHSRLEAVFQDLERYCEHAKQFCGSLKRYISQIEPFMNIFPRTTLVH